MQKIQKILVFLCLLSAFLFAKELDVNRIKQGDFTELKAYLTQLKSISKQRDLNFNEYRTLTRFALVDGIDGVYNGGSNRGFASVYYSKLSPFLAKEFGDLFAEYGIPLGNDIEEIKPEYYLYNELVFWFNDSKQIFTTKKAYESFLFFKHNAAFATKIDEEGQEIRNCAYGDAGGGECEFIFKKPVKAKGILTFNADFSSPPNEVDACDYPAYFSTFKTQDSRLEFINDGHIVLDKREYYDKLAQLLPKWYKNGLGGSVGYEVEVEIAGIMPWSFSACAAGKYVTITNIKVGKMLRDNPNTRKDYIENIESELNVYRLKLNSTDRYVNLRDKPNGKILEQIPTAKSDAILLLNLNMSLWEVKGVSEWQRQLGYERAEFSGYEEVMGREWIKVLYFPPSLSPKTQTITEAKIGYIHKSQLIMGDLP
ncbi:hypothetical protein LS77_000460 [Helicobacter bilis]|uniref:Uncharacterized protein n=2 Tax=Helicobacter bilis TaxID=37372 RepID=A0A6D2CGZ0_9HELI|nr:hypothetical protein [Helicobacter bilis]EMZ39109.1 hypothetical protein C826_01085 [Helicobacter bilis WiWa]TLE06556.1 hypothetical protein LS77_000460 [Helicobacter bilis]TLE07027.1 hypothetical protein LS76_000720 [Helicobacter bilis]